MMRRRTENLADSLDLLLDTICNTFGAVIFISILVAILVGRSSADREQPADATATENFLHDQQQKIAEARMKLQRLSLQQQQQQALIDRLTTEASRELAAELFAASATQVALSQQRTSAVDSVNAIQAQHLQLEQQLNEQREALATASAKNKELQVQLQAATELASRTATIPRLRRTSKQGVTFMLYRTRLFRAVTPDGTIDDVDCLESVRLQTIVISPRPGAGVAVSSENDPHLRGRFDQIRQNDHFIRLFVARDSFAQFQTVKNVLIQLGYEYEVVLFSEGDAELYLSPDSVESFVQ